MFNWETGLTDSEASLVGSFAGSAIGLFAVLIGALFNAHLNRRRDDRLRSMERTSVMAALRAELSGLSGALKSNATTLSNSMEGFYVRDLAHSVVVLPSLVPKLGLLDSETIRQVIAAYGLGEQYAENLQLMGGRLKLDDASKRRLIFMQKESAKHVTDMNLKYSQAFETAMRSLET